MEKAHKTLLFIVAIAAVAGVANGMVGYLDSRWADAKETGKCITELRDHIVLVDRRLEQSIDMDRYRELDSRIYRLEQRFPANNRPPEIEKEIVTMQKEMEKIEHKWRKN